MGQPIVEAKTSKTAAERTLYYKTFEGSHADDYVRDEAFAEQITAGSSTAAIQTGDTDDTQRQSVG